MAPAYSTEELKVIGANIRRLREPRWKLRHFARLVKTSPGHLSSIENGRRRADLTLYTRIAEMLGTTVEALAEKRDVAGAA